MLFPPLRIRCRSNPERFRSFARLIDGVVPAVAAYAVEGGISDFRDSIRAGSNNVGGHVELQSSRAPLGRALEFNAADGAKLLIELPLTGSHVPVNRLRVVNMHMPASQTEKISLPCLRREFRQIGYCFAFGKPEIDSFSAVPAMQKRATATGRIAHYAAEYTIVREPNVPPHSLQARRSSVALVVVLCGTLLRLWCGPVCRFLTRRRCRMGRLCWMRRRSVLNHWSRVRLWGRIRCRWRPRFSSIGGHRTVFRSGRPRLLRLSRLFRSSSLGRSCLLRGPCLVRGRWTIYRARRLRMSRCRPVLRLRGRPARCHCRRPAMVHGFEVVAVRRGIPLMRGLGGRGRNMTIMLGCDLRGCRTSRDPAGTVKARTVHCHVVYHRAVDVGVVHHDWVHPHHRCVVAEMAAFPHSADKACAEIAKPVIHASVEPNMGAPIARMPQIRAIVETPVPRSPQ